MGIEKKQFNCQRCGWCCKNVNINVSYSDILRWAKEKRFDILNRISYIDHKDKKKKGFYITETVTAPKKPCSFLKKKNGLYFCSIYETRPRACKEFPQSIEKKEKIECPAKNDFQLDEKELFKLKRDQNLDFRLAEDRKEKLIKILKSVREVANLLNEIKEFGEDPTETLWVDGLGSEKTGWTGEGTPPYLNSQNEPTDYVWTTTKKSEHGDFTFPVHTVGSGTINSVTFYVYCKNDTGKEISFYIWDGIEWTEYPITLPTTWGWENILVPVLDSWAKIDGAKLYITQPNQTDKSWIDAAYLIIDYTPAGGVPIKIEKSLKYTVKTIPTAKTKSLKYTIITTPSATTKGLIYKAKPSIEIQKSLKYCVVAEAGAIQKSLKYTVIITPTKITKSLQYEITSVSTEKIEKTLKYTVVTTPTEITKSLQYCASPAISIQKSLKYTVKTTPTAETKSLAYNIFLGSTDIQKTLIYDVIKSPKITKSLEYVIAGQSVKIEKSLKYTISTTPTAINKTLKYTVISTPSAKTKQLKYNIFLGITKIEKSLNYAVVSTPIALTKDLTYSVIITPTSIEKSLSYKITITQTAIQKQLNYEILTITGVQKSLKYTVVSPVKIQKSLQYNIVGGIPVKIQKLLKYTILRIYPYDPTESPYEPTESPYTPDISPYVPFSI